MNLIVFVSMRLWLLKIVRCPIVLTTVGHGGWFGWVKDEKMETYWLQLWHKQRYSLNLQNIHTTCQRKDITYQSRPQRGDLSRLSGPSNVVAMVLSPVSIKTGGCTRTQHTMSIVSQVRCCPSYPPILVWEHTVHYFFLVLLLNGESFPAYNISPPSSREHLQTRLVHVIANRSARYSGDDNGSPGLQYILIMAVSDGDGDGAQVPNNNELWLGRRGGWMVEPFLIFSMWGWTEHALLLGVPRWRHLRRFRKVVSLIQALMNLHIVRESSFVWRGSDSDRQVRCWFSIGPRREVHIIIYTMSPLCPQPVVTK